MIDLEKEIHNFEYFCNDFGDVNLAKEKTYRYKSRQTQIMWTYWKARAKLAKAQITDLKQKLEKLESGEFVLVPREPTLEMLKAADKHVMDCHATPESAYKVMIEAVESGNFNSDIQAMNKDLSNGVITGENFDNLSDDRGSGER